MHQGAQRESVWTWQETGLGSLDDIECPCRSIVSGSERARVDQQPCTGATRVSCLCKMAGDFHHSTWPRGDPSECCCRPCGAGRRTSSRRSDATLRCTVPRSTFPDTTASPVVTVALLDPGTWDDRGSERDDLVPPGKGIIGRPRPVTHCLPNADDDSFDLQACYQHQALSPLV